MTSIISNKEEYNVQSRTDSPAFYIQTMYVIGQSDERINIVKNEVERGL